MRVAKETWYTLNAKFGVYCHWELHSVLEHEWYSHWVYVDKNNPEGKKWDSAEN